MRHIVKHGSIALGLALMMTTLCYGQSTYLVQWAPYSGPPHNVIYWNGGSNLLQTLASSNYTDVIVSFLVPDPSCNILNQPNGGLPSDIQNSINTLHMFSKTVLVSFGGEFPDPVTQSTAYAACANNMTQLEDQLVSIVTSNGFDGVDIDFEDSNALQGIANPPYNAIPFLTNLTNDLETRLGQNCPLQPMQFPPCLSIITHAPQSPYWTPAFNSAYLQIAINTNVNGQSNIAWYNNQTYNQCGAAMTGTDCTVTQKVMEYETIVNSGLVMPTQLVVGLPVSQCATNSDNRNAPGAIIDPAACTHDGWIQLINQSGPGNNDVLGLMFQLEQTYPARFGGVMGWNYSFDVTNPNLPGDPSASSWGLTIGNYLANLFLVDSAATWAGGNYATGNCLDGNGGVSTDTCAGLPSQNWQFNGSALVNVQSKMCLDSNPAGTVYTNQCNGGPYQSWLFYGSFVLDRQTRLCLQDNNGTVITAGCDSTNPSQRWHNANLPGSI